MAVSFSAFARLMRVSPQAVAKAKKSGRLLKSIGVDERGRPAIVDTEQARQEWHANAGKEPRRRADPPVADPGISVFRLGGRVALAWGEDLNNPDTTKILEFTDASAIHIGEALIAKARQGEDDSSSAPSA